MKISNPTAVLGENLACNYLEKKGYKIIERNYRKSYTEIDIICVKKDKVLVFVEVKTRTNDKFGTPLEQIPSKKLYNLIKTAEFYSSVNPSLPKMLRIDAIGIELSNNEEVKRIDHLENITL